MSVVATWLLVGSAAAVSPQAGPPADEPSRHHVGGSVGAALGGEPHGLGPAMTLEAGTRLQAFGGRLQPHVSVGLAAPSGTDELALGDRQTIWHLRTWQVGPRAGLRMGLLPPGEPTVPELSVQSGVCWVYTVSRTELGGQASAPVSDGGWTVCGAASVGLTRQTPTWALGAALTVELAPLTTPLAEPDLLVLPTFGLTWRKAL